ncbi:hypothetical protein WJX73_005787 [Symbiochloris irregularis]|uniref:Uncharacterized protein n=1 Tax=Symbiochloris irregularis TaxID=706552 RepID=A0AAW1PSA5_9CHLO
MAAGDSDFSYGGFRHEDVLAGEISHLLQGSRLPVLAQPYPPFVQKLFKAVVALRSGQRVAYLDESVFVDNIQDFSHNAHRLTSQLDNPSLVPDEMAQVRAEMTAAVGCMRFGMSTALRSRDMSWFTRATAALMQYEASAYAALPSQTVVRAQSTHLEYMQLSPGQVARVASMGIDLIATLRQLGASSGTEDDLQLLYPSFTGASDRARDAKLEVVARMTMQLCCAEWLADEQEPNAAAGALAYCTQDPLRTQGHHSSTPQSSQNTARDPQSSHSTQARSP